MGSGDGGFIDLAALLGWPGEIRPSTFDIDVLSEIYGQDVYQARHRIVEGSVVVDLGANVGFFTCWALDHGAQVVHAYEPVHDTVVQLHRNIRLWAGARGYAPNVPVYRAAAGPQRGRATLQYEGPSKAHHAYVDFDTEGSTPVVTLADIVSRAGGRVNVLKMDIEGAEFGLILQADTATLDACDYITMEFHASKLLSGHPYEAGSVGEMVEKLMETHGIQTLGRASAGGYLYCTRFGS